MVMDYHEEVLKKAGIKYTMKHISDQDLNIRQELSNCFQEHQVAIIVIKRTVFPELRVPTVIKVFMSLQGANLFVDDMQCVILGWDDLSDKYYTFFATLLNLSERCHVWLACDVTQSVLAKFFVKDHYVSLAKSLKETLSSSQIVGLTKVLRNSFDLSSILSTIRNHLIGLNCSQCDDINILFPFQNPGHYIHGPKTTVHVLENFNEDLILTIFDKELQKLCQGNAFDMSDVVVLSNRMGDGMGAVMESLIKSIQETVSGPEFSTEWPAVIVLHSLTEQFLKEQMQFVIKTWGGKSQDLRNYEWIDLSYLYLAMSRARVKCTVIVFPMNDILDQDCFKHMKDIFHEQNNLLEVKKYPLTKSS